MTFWIWGPFALCWGPKSEPCGLFCVRANMIIMFLGLSDQICLQGRVDVVALPSCRIQTQMQVRD